MYGSCTTPIMMRMNETDVDHERGVRCRHCPGCLRAKRHLWRLRAEAETLKAPKTWFFTGTFRDQTADIEVVKGECTRFLKRLRKRCGRGLRYLLVYESHKSGNLHVHALLHDYTDSGISYRDIKRSWTAGFIDAKLCDWKSAGYVTKYATKGVGEGQTERPRIRASRKVYLGAKLQDGFEGPELVLQDSYGGWVMERDQEVVKELLKARPDENLADLWEKNLRQLMKELRPTPTPQRVMMETIVSTQCRSWDREKNSLDKSSTS